MGGGAQPAWEPTEGAGTRSDPQGDAGSECQERELEDRRSHPAGLLHCRYCFREKRGSAFKITPDGPSLFANIKEDSRSRIQDTAISADTLLPEGPYNLWREGETSRRLQDLVGAFALSPQLPKMLNRQAILDTLVQGCKEGQFVLRVVRPDRSVRTFWRQEPDEAALKDRSLEVVLVEAAELAEVSGELLTPGRLPGLWTADSVSFGDICHYFSGAFVAKIDKGGYEESFRVPKASREALAAAVREAVKQGRLWLTSGQASILREDIPAGLLTEDAKLQAPPAPIPATDLTSHNLTEVWSDGSTTALAIAVGLSKKAGINLPWATVRDAIDGAIRARLIERALDSAPWPCEFAAAHNVKLRVAASPPPPPEKPRPNVLVAEAELRPNEIQELADRLKELRRVAGNAELRFRVHLELDAGDTSPLQEVVDQLNELLAKVSKALALR
jgi:hypothetical protein